MEVEFLWALKMLTWNYIDDERDNRKFYESRKSLIGMNFFCTVSKI
jgi:hypothetical protein